MFEQIASFASTFSGFETVCLVQNWADRCRKRAWQATPGCQEQQERHAPIPRQARGGATQKKRPKIIEKIIWRLAQQEDSMKFGTPNFPKTISISLSLPEGLTAESSATAR
eukprot:s3292_g4.t1